MKKNITPAGHAGPAIMAAEVLSFLFLTVIPGLPLRAQTGVYTQNGSTASQSNQTYTATLADQSSVYVLNSGISTLTNCTMTKTGDASNVSNSSQYGINAGVLATTASSITLVGGTVTTNASGANGLFATGTGSSVTMSNGTMDVSGTSAHGVDATYGGSITLTNVNVNTDGSNSSALATDFGGGTVTVTGGTIISSATASGSHSAGIYSTGVITVTGASVTSSGDCGGVIDGANSIILSNTSLTGALHGVKTWKTAPASGSATVNMTGGSLTATSGDAFYVTGETGNGAATNITVSGGAAISAGSGKIMDVISSSTASFTAGGETLTGDLYADATSTLTAKLENGTGLTGSARNTGITIDATSTWTVTANSVMTTVIDPSGISGLTVTNIIGNGHNVHYDSSLSGNQYLGGLTYSLVNGGVLTPGSVLGIAPQETIAAGCILLQNYPDPAAETTTLAFELQQRTNVTLKVFDLKGKQVAAPAEGLFEAGLHEISFDIPGLPNGIYIISLTVGDAVQMKRMVIGKQK